MTLDEILDQIRALWGPSGAKFLRIADETGIARSTVQAVVRSAIADDRDKMRRPTRSNAAAVLAAIKQPEVNNAKQA